MGAHSAPKGEGTFLGHPRGLATLFMTEMWERFSFYGLRAILVLFFVASTANGGLGLEETTANALLGIYMALIYLVALPGGWIADRILGARKAVLWGAVIIMAGHISMAIPVSGPAFVFLGLFLIVCGTGLLKPNISTMVGKLYTDDADARRDAGFSLFYMGINLGAFIAPFITGWLGQQINWHLAFGAAAVGMALGLIQYISGTGLKGVGEEPGHRLTAQERSHFSKIAVAGVAVVAVLAVAAAMTGTLTLDNFTIALTVVAVAVPVLYFAYILFGSHSLTPAERARLQAYIWLFVAAAIFWMIYDLQAGPINLFVEQKVDLNFFGFTIPSSWNQAISPVLILLFAPVFAWLWIKLGNRVSAPLKFAFALVMVGLSFVIMAGAAKAAMAGKISMLWIVVVYLVQCFGELSLSPVGLSVTIKLAPHAFSSQMMGVWFLATAVGDAVGGQTPRLKGLMSESMYYLTLGLIAVVAGIALFMFVRKLKTLMGEHQEETAAGQMLTH